MRPLGALTSLLCLAALPALLALYRTTDNYLETTREIADLRFEIVDIHAEDGPSGLVPAVTLVVHGPQRASLRLAEVDVDLDWQGKTVASGLAYPNVSLLRNTDTTVTVRTTINQDYAAQTRALLASGQAPFALNGRARVLLPQGDVPVWLELHGAPRGG